MKKFVLLCLLFFCAPLFAYADTLGCVAGGTTGVGLGSLMGGGNGKVAAEVILGLMGCDTGSRIEDGTYGRSRQPVKTIIIEQGSYGEDLYPQVGYGGHPSRQPQYMQRAVYSVPQGRVFERPEARAQQSRPSPQDSEGPTIDDYMSPKWAQVIPEDCRTGNWGHDSICLYGEVKTLKAKQEACDYDKNKCNPHLNFQKMAWYDRNLADALRRAQDKYAVK